MSMMNKEIHRYDLTYIPDAPYIVAGLYFFKKSDIQDLWRKGTIVLTDTELWLPEEDQWNILPLTAIEMFGRTLPTSSLRDVHDTTGYTSVLVVDYKKQSSFGTHEVISTILFAGENVTIMEMRVQLARLLGLSRYAELNLTEDDRKLLYLLSEGIKKKAILVMVFGGDKEKLRKSFNNLKKAELCTKSADLTSKGRDFIARLGRMIEGELGEDAIAPLKGLDPGDGNEGREAVNTVSWSSGKSYMVGRVEAELLWQHIPFPVVADVKLSDMGTQLRITTTYGATIRIKSTSPPVLMSLFDLTQAAREKIPYASEPTKHITNLLALGVRDTTIISDILKITESNVKKELDQMVSEGVVNRKYELMADAGDLDETD